MINPTEEKNRHVLVIDDNRAIHDDFRKILSPAAVPTAAADATEEALYGRPVDAARQIRFEMDSAYQGHEGAVLVKKALTDGRPYALAFVDVRMPPGWDGVETTRKIWELDPDLQVVLCTAYSDYSWADVFAKLGQHDGLLILKKPFDAVEALQLAHALTEKWWLHRQSRRKMEVLEGRVAERTGELRQTNNQLLEASHQAALAEAATGVLHNVGNVLNSVNVASFCVADSIRKSRAGNLTAVAAMLQEHKADLGAFLTADPKGKQIPDYLAQLAERLATEQAGALKELAGLQKNIEHIKALITMQQSFAKASDIPELISVTDLVEDALSMNSSALARHDIAVTREFQTVPPITVAKHKVLQILINLVRNAKQACDESNPPEKRLTLRVTNGTDHVRIDVADNGIGIRPENLTHIFAHGFTTKKSGHGFGLHSAALAAREMGGALKVHSDGHGQGSTFSLELPWETLASAGESKTGIENE